MSPNIIYEDTHIIVCEKPPNIATETGKIGQIDLISELKNYLSTQNKQKNPYLGMIHRLDQPVHGILLFAKTEQAAKELSRQLVDHTLKKYYYAVVCGYLTRESGVLVDYLKKEVKGNISKVVTKNIVGAKKASLAYSHVETKNQLHLMEIELETGRHHQIRVQMANVGLPLLGDLKYGNEGESSEKSKTVALCAYKISFVHPVSKEKMTYSIKPILDVFQQFNKFQEIEKK